MLESDSCGKCGRYSSTYTCVSCVQQGQFARSGVYTDDLLTKEMITLHSDRSTRNAILERCPGKDEGPIDDMESSRRSAQEKVKKIKTKLTETYANKLFNLSEIEMKLDSAREELSNSSFDAEIYKRNELIHKHKIRVGHLRNLVEQFEKTLTKLQEKKAASKLALKEKKHHLNQLYQLNNSRVGGTTFQSTTRQTEIEAVTKKIVRIRREKIKELVELFQLQQQPRSITLQRVPAVAVENFEVVCSCFLSLLRFLHNLAQILEIPPGSMFGESREYFQGSTLQEVLAEQTWEPQETSEEYATTDSAQQNEHRQKYLNRLVATVNCNLCIVCLLDGFDLRRSFQPKKGETLDTFGCLFHYLDSSRNASLGTRRGVSDWVENDIADLVDLPEDEFVMVSFGEF
eukprot:m.71299 g.71299  ORF g.71299 m.71299 type:complete len:402 (+) comp12235_c0_seq1:179-1384(+)